MLNSTKNKGGDTVGQGNSEGFWRKIYCSILYRTCLFRPLEEHKEKIHSKEDQAHPLVQPTPVSLWKRARATLRGWYR